MAAVKVADASGKKEKAKEEDSMVTPEMCYHCFNVLDKALTHKAHPDASQAFPALKLFVFHQPCFTPRRRSVKPQQSRSVLDLT